MMTNPQIARAIAAASTEILTALGIAFYRLCVAIASFRRTRQSDYPGKDGS